MKGESSPCREAECVGSQDPSNCHLKSSTSSCSDHVRYHGERQSCLTPAAWQSLYSNIHFGTPQSHKIKRHYTEISLFVSHGSSAQVKLSPAVWSGCRASAVQRTPGWVQWSHKPLSELFLPVQFPQNCVFSSTCKKKKITVIVLGISSQWYIYIPIKRLSGSLIQLFIASEDFCNLPWKL